MTRKNVPNSYVWIIMLVLPLLFFVWTIPLLLLSGGQDILEQGLKLAGSHFAIGDLDEAALGFLNMSMLKPVWKEIWIGLLGIYCAIGLKQRKKHAWALSLFWGIMLLTSQLFKVYTRLLSLIGHPPACKRTYSWCWAQSLW